MQSKKPRVLFWLVVLLTIVGSQGSVMAFTVKGRARSTTTGWVPYNAEVKAFEVDPVPGSGFTVDPTLLASAVVDKIGHFTITFPWPSGGSGYEIDGPDLVFRITQDINGSVETIYEESPSEAHWNLVDGIEDTLWLTSEVAAFFNPSLDPSNPGSSVPNNKLFLFTRIGNYETADIDCRGSNANSKGYARPQKAPYNFSGMDTDQPFGATLDLFAWFGRQSKIDYYKVQYSTDGGSTWNDIDTHLPNKWYDTSNSNPLKWHWVSESMGPFSDGGVDNLYKIPYFERVNTPWTWFDRIARFNTSHIQVSLCRFRIIGYKKTVGGSVLPTTSSDFLIDPNYGEIVLKIDNTGPIVKIHSLLLNGSQKNPCAILVFGSGANDKIEVKFEVADNQGHLRDFSLQALYGHNNYVTPPTGAYANYENNSSNSPSWFGSSSFTVTYKGSDYPSSSMPPCAYQFRLNASKRTTNGYGLIYPWLEDTWHVTIDRP